MTATFVIFLNSLSSSVHVKVIIWCNIIFDHTDDPPYGKKGFDDTKSVIRNHKSNTDR